MSRFDQGNWKPTGELRWFVAETEKHMKLQQFFAPEMPAYMRNKADGEWRDVPVVKPLPAEMAKAMGLEPDAKG